MLLSICVIKIAFREGLHFTVEKEMKDSKGRILMLKIIIQNSKYLLINVKRFVFLAVILKTLHDLLFIINRDKNRYLFPFWYSLKTTLNGGA